MRVLIAEHDHPVYAQLLRQAAPDLEVLTSGDSAELASQAADCPIWLGQPDLLANLLRQGHQPQWLQSTWAGITPLLADGLRRDYRLTRAVGIFGQVMAEYVLTYMLGHEREVLARLVSQVERKWDSRQGQSLAGRKVLIVGTGDIGLTVAKFLVPFGVELYGIASEAREQAPFVEVGVLADLPRLVGEVDFVINLLPNTPNTHDLYDAALFKQFKPTGLFINVGRGVAVVDADLVEALKEGHLAGAVIDVCRQEPLPQRHPFWTAWGLLLT
ncbi:MAG: D-2-hydroxyacid dehydrogenase, partial [Pseudomonas mandelii]